MTCERNGIVLRQRGVVSRTVYGFRKVCKSGCVIVLHNGSQFSRRHSELTLSLPSPESVSAQASVPEAAAWIACSGCELAQLAWL